MNTPLSSSQSQLHTPQPQPPQSQPQPQSQSNTNTPYQLHEQLNESITWIKDWHSPFLQPRTNTTTDTTTLNDDSTMKIKTWYKTNINHKINPLSNNNQHYLNLDQYKYFDHDSNSDEQIESSNPSIHSSNQQFTNAIKLENDDSSTL